MSGSHFLFPSWLVVTNLQKCTQNGRMRDMMINKRLFSTVKENKKYIAGNVISQWISLAANISMMAAIAKMLQALYEGTVTEM